MSTVNRMAARILGKAMPGPTDRCRLAAVNRMAARIVGKAMRRILPGARAVAMATLVAVATGAAGMACGGGTKKGPSGPGSAGAGAGAGGGGAGAAGERSEGSVVYQDMPGGFAPADTVGGVPPGDGASIPDRSGGDGAGGASTDSTGAAGTKAGAGVDGGGGRGADGAGGAATGGGDGVGSAASAEIRPPGSDLPPERRDQLVTQHLVRAGQAIRAHQPDTVIREARAALDLDETNVEAMLVLAHGYYLKSYDDKAEAILQIAKKHPAGERHPVLWMLLGLVADRGGREDDAIVAYEKASTLKDDYVAAWINRGAIYLERKRYADAVAAFEKVVAIQPRSARAYAMLGAAYRGRSADLVNDPEGRDALLRKAEHALKTAMAIEPGYAPAYFNLGILYLDADPFPGLETLPRLQAAIRYLNEYKRMAGAQVKAGDPVEQHLEAAQKAYDREVKRQEKAKKRKEKDQQEAAKQEGGNP